ncbi:MAG: HesA/MoeB/ThiF family protein [Candidatus Bathyarchaeia archaeon]
MDKSCKTSFKEFYKRQIVMKELGEKGQKRLLNSKVAVVGLGGLGSASSIYLARAGVGKLRLIDKDKVEIHNLHRQVLYTYKDVGRLKTEAAAERLKELNPYLKVETFQETLNLTNAEHLLKGVDCIVDGLDNMQTRYILNRASVKLKIPFIFGAAVGMEGNLSVFNPPETPCLECILPNIDDKNLPKCEVRGVLGPTPGIIGTMQAMETIKILTGIGSPLKGKLMIFDFNDTYITTIDIQKRENCPTCQPK